MCDFAKGIVDGLQAEYAQEVAIQDLACMHGGDPECTIEITLAG